MGKPKKKKRKTKKTSIMEIASFIMFLILFILLMFLLFNKFKIHESIKDFLKINNTNNESQDDSNSESNDETGGSSSSEEEEEEEVILTPCSNIPLGAYGDFGSVCEVGACDNSYNCDHYWDYNNQKHKCGCVETSFCGQYCYDYYFTTGCECPPDSYIYNSDRSHYACVPNGYICVDGNVEEEMGPFPE